MPSLVKKSNGYYAIVFTQTTNGKVSRKNFSLKTKKKTDARRKFTDYENRYFEGEIDPFKGWTPELDKASPENKPSLSLNALADKFIQERSHANAVTKRNYRAHLRMLINDLGETMPVHLITESDIRTFCFKPQVKPVTQKSYLRHIKVFFSWLHEKELVKKNICAGIKPPKVVNNVSEKTINRDGLQKLISTFKKDIREKTRNRSITTKQQARTWFVPLVIVVYYQGLRAKEIVNLRWEHINLKDKLMTVVNTKNKTDRTIPIRDNALDALNVWHRYQKRPNLGLVFPSPKSHTRQIKLTEGWVSKTFRKYADLAGLPSTVTFHGVRHSCGTELHRMGLDIYDLGKFLGNTLDATKIYIHNTEIDLQNRISKLEIDES